MDKLRKFDLIYLGTPYSKFPLGIEAAFAEACKLTAKLLVAGLKVYSPIAHTHPIAHLGCLDPYDLNIWLPFDKAIMNKSDAMLVAQMPTWEKSTGIAEEMKAFLDAWKPVYFLNPSTMEVSQ